MSPVIDTPLLHGGQTQWDKVCTDVSVRCTRCRMVHPGKYMVEVENGLCRECREKDKPNKEAV